MGNRELLGLRDLWLIVLSAVALAVVICGGSGTAAFFASGGNTPSVSLSANVAQATPAHPAAPVTAKSLVASMPQVIKSAVVAPRTYVIHKGDNLTKIAKKMYGNPKAWPNIYWANKTTVKYADIIVTGNKLTIPVPTAKIPAAPAVLAPAPPPPPRPAYRSQAVTHVTYATPASSGHSYYRTQTSSRVSASDYSGQQECIIAAESGGQSQIFNGSGHYGLYQFSEDTWIESGGSAADFGHASVTEQNQVFDNAVAARGYSDWDPYDGC